MTSKFEDFVYSFAILFVTFSSFIFPFHFVYHSIFFRFVRIFVFCILFVFRCMAPAIYFIPFESFYREMLLKWRMRTNAQQMRAVSMYKCIVNLIYLRDLSAGAKKEFSQLEHIFSSSSIIPLFLYASLFFSSYLISIFSSRFTSEILFSKRREREERNCIKYEME